MRLSLADETIPGFRYNMRFNNFYRFVKPYRGLIAASILFHMICTGMGLLMPWLLKVIIDRALGGSDLTLLFVLLGIILLIYSIRSIFFYVCNYLTNYAALRMLFDLRVNIFKHIQSLSLRFYQEYRTGKLISNILTDVSVLQGMASTVIVQLSSSLFMICFVTVALIILSPKLSIICLAMIPIMINFAYFRNSLNRDSQALRERMSEVSANLAETLNGIKVVKSFGKERAESLNFLEMLKPTFNMSLNFSMKNIMCWLITEQIHIYCIVTALGWGGYLVSKGEMTIGSLVAFYSYLQMLAGPLINITSLSPAISDGTTSAERLMKLMEATPEIKECEKPVHMDHAKGRLAFKDVRFAYDQKRPVLKDFSLDVKPGLKVALVGPSGSGKSTIASLLMRFFDVSAGKITIDGVDIRQLDLDSLRRNVGIVLQESFLFSGTIEENIRYGREDASMEEVIEAAKMANAYEFIEKLPKGFKSEVGENGVSLSGGQKQRLAIARAVLRNPAILILDEATSALDTVSEGVVQEALDKLMLGRTTIIIAHRLSTVRNADLLVVLKDGEIIQKGTHEKLLLEDGLYRELYAMQLKDEGKDDQDADGSEYDGTAAA